MAWFSGKVNLGNFPDLAGAVNKLSESVKNIEKNFDNALGFEEKSDNNAPTTNLSATEGTSSLWPSSSDRKTLFDPFNAFMGHKSEETTPESPKKEEDVTYPSPPEEIEKTDTEKSKSSVSELPAPVDDGHQLVRIDADESHSKTAERKSAEIPSHEVESDLPKLTAESSEVVTKNAESPDALNQLQDKEITEGVSSDNSHPAPETEPVQGNLGTVEVDQIDTGILVPVQDIHGSESHEHKNECKTSEEEISANVSPVKADVLTDSHSAAGSEPSSSSLSNCEDIKIVDEGNTRGFSDSHSLKPDFTMVTELPPQINNAVSEVKEVKQQPEDYETHTEEPQLSSVVTSVFDVGESTAELEKLKKEMKMMETALQGAARQAQAKADEIARMMNENEQLKSVIDDLRRQSNEAEIESLREEYHQRVATLERKVYALTKERDTLRREQNRKSDAAALLKEKDEIINQVMAEGEELSKKQAAQESQIRKLRAQIREFEEEKKSLTTKLQGKENKVESIKKDKAATEKLIQETIEKHQAELAVQKEYYTNALAAAKEAEALAEARANNEARTELESRLREAEDREAMLVQALEELRQTLSRQEQQAVYREDMLNGEIEDLQKRYQASERRCEELITQVSDSTRPLLRQIEAMQETTARKAEGWAAVERSLTSRLQEAEIKAAAAEERERSVNKRLSQTLSRVDVLEAQISCLREEQTQVSRSLEKERNRAAENRQEYLVAKEEADTQEGRANQLEEEIKELRKKHKQELQEALMYRELLQQLEELRADIVDLEMYREQVNMLVNKFRRATMRKSAVVLMALSPPKGNSFLLSSLSPLSYSTVTTRVPFCGFHSLVPSNEYQKDLLGLEGIRLYNFLQTHCRTGFNCVEDALILFSHMIRLRPLPIAINFNQLLSGVVRMKEYSVAASLFKEIILLEKIPSDAWTSSIVINCYCHLNLVDMGFSLLGRILKLGYEPNIVTYSTLLNGLCSGDRVVEAVSLFNRMMKWKEFRPNEFTYGTIVKGLCSTGNTKTAINLLRIMENRGLKPDTILYSTIIDSLCKDHMVDDALELFHEMVRKGLDPNVITYSPLIYGLCISGRWKEAAGKLTEMMDMGISPDKLTYNILVDAYVKEGHIDEAEAVIQMMTNRGEDPDVVTFNSLMEGYCLQGHMNKSVDVFKSMESKGIAPDDFSYNVLLNGYCKKVQIDEAMRLFEEMRQKGIKPSAVNYDTVIHGLFQAKRSGAAIKLFNERKAAGLHPSVVSFNIMLDGLCKEGRMNDALSFLVEMESNSIDPDIICYGILIDALCKDGKFQIANDLLSHLSSRGLQPNKRIYGSMIHGHCKHGLLSEAKEIFLGMERNGCPPDDVTYCIIIQGFLEKNETQDAITLLQEMVARGFSPSPNTLTRLLDILPKEDAINIFSKINLLKH